MGTEQVKHIIEEAMTEISERIKGVFADRRGREMSLQYIEGLMSTAERKNGWQMAEAPGQRTPYAIQQFLYRGGWDANELRNTMREYIKDKPGDPQGVMVVVTINNKCQKTKKPKKTAKLRKTALKHVWRIFDSLG